LLVLEIGGNARILCQSPQIKAPASFPAAGRLLPYGTHSTSSKLHFNLPCKISNSTGKNPAAAAQFLLSAARSLHILTVPPAALTVQTHYPRLCLRKKGLREPGIRGQFLRIWAPVGRRRQRQNRRFSGRVGRRGGPLLRRRQRRAYGAHRA